MRFDPTNPQKVPLPAPVPKKKRGQQKIPPVPVTAGTIRKISDMIDQAGGVQPIAGKIDLDSIQFEPAPSVEVRVGPVSEMRPAAPWRRITVL